MSVSDGGQTGQNVPALFFVFMGVSGVGKSTIAKAVADALGGAFVEADDLHPSGNVERMRAGLPLSDEDRWPWLNEVCDTAMSRTPPVMVSCSALKQSYRNFIASLLPGVVFIHLTGPSDLIRERMASRKGHFMPVSLLDSQLSILEAPDESPTSHCLDITKPQMETVAEAISICRQHLEPPEVSGEAFTP